MFFCSILLLRAVRKVLIISQLFHSRDEMWQIDFSARLSPSPLALSFSLNHFHPKLIRIVPSFLRCYLAHSVLPTLALSLITGLSLRPYSEDTLCYLELYDATLSLSLCIYLYVYT